jgi:hypothetical protein
LSKKNEKNYQNPNILRTIAIINIIFIIIDVCLVPLRDEGPSSDTRYFVNDVYYIIIRSFFGLVPFLITFGVLMFIFGKRNQEQFGKYLKISGILAGIGYGISILAYLFISISIFVYNPSDILRSLVSPLTYVGFGLLIGCYIFIIIHGTKNRDKNFTIFGSLYLIGFISALIVSIILYTLFPN